MKQTKNDLSTFNSTKIFMKPTGEIYLDINYICDELSN